MDNPLFLGFVDMILELFRQSGIFLFFILFLAHSEYGDIVQIHTREPLVYYYQGLENL